MLFSSTYSNDSRVRSRFFIQLSLTFGFLFLVLLARLAYLQIVQGDYHYRLSLENMMRLKTIKAPRGKIFDRDGRLLVRNRLSRSIAIYPYKVKDTTLLFERLVKLKGLDGLPVFTHRELSTKYKKARRRRFDPTILKEDVGMDLVSVVEEHTLDLPGVGIETEIRREYPFGTLASHLFGYISEIPEDQFDSLRNFGYAYGDLVGKTGIEKQYEDLFRGRNGQQYVEVNAFGKELDALEDMPHTNPIPGHDLFLTIDLDIQKAAEEAFPDSLKGALVALDPRNGEVLALLSSPRPDPNLFTLATKKRTKLWAEVAMDSRMPLNNRAVMGTYPPGSTFKMVTCIAGLQDELITPTEKFRSSCRGSYRFGRRVFRCWKPSGHGKTGVVGALKVSCDVYFYQLGLRVGAERINRYARSLGFDRITGIDLPNEKAGMLLNEENYNRKFRDRGWKWTKGMVLNLSIGQGQIVTPLQLANFVGGLGNGKVLYRPHVLKEIQYSDERNPKKTEIEVLQNIAFKKGVLETIRQGMDVVVNERGGTGGRARIKDVTVLGKTGSAENPQGERTHALFVAVAPADSPSIAISVVVENAGHGGSIAAPMAAHVLNAYFKKFPPVSEALAEKDKE